MTSQSESPSQSFAWSGGEKITADGKRSGRDDNRTDARTHFHAAPMRAADFIEGPAGRLRCGAMNVRVLFPVC